MKYAKNIAAPALFYIFFGFCIGVFLYRGGYEIWGNLPLVRTFVGNSHVTNFVLSAILVLCGGQLPGARRQYTLLGILAASVVLLNIVVESGTGLFNVPDPVDAISGILGVGIALSINWVISRMNVPKQVHLAKQKQTITALMIFFSYLALCFITYLSSDSFGQWWGSLMSFSLTGILVLCASSYEMMRSRYYVIGIIAGSAVILGTTRSFDLLDICASSCGAAGAAVTIWLIRKTS